MEIRLTDRQQGHCFKWKELVAVLTRPDPELACRSRQGDLRPVPKDKKHQCCNIFVFRDRLPASYAQ